MTAQEHDRIIDLIKREVVLSIGCTEPMAVSLCVAKACETLGTQPKHISVALSANIFKNAMGVSPKEYLTKYRLDKARGFLTETTLPIGKIAECVGFQSFSSFSRLFIAQYQQSPSQYRKVFLKEEADEPCLGSH